MAGPYRVAVVGLGVAGAATAYLLAKDGHQVTVLEQSPEVGAVGAGIMLQPSGQRVLKHLGLLEAVIARSAPLDELCARHDTGTLLIRSHYADYAPGCCAYGVHRGVLFNALNGLMRTIPVDVRLGCEVVSREVAEDHVTMVDAAGKRHGPFDFLVAGDGSRSRLRAALGFQATVQPYSHGTLWVVAPGTGMPRRLFQVVRGNRKLFGLLPLGDGLVTLYWGLPAREFPELRARGLPALKQEILAFAPESAEVLEFIVDFQQLILTTYQHVSMRRWHDATAIFIGDAAHAMSPHLGQGVNLALLDAWRLADCLRSEPNPAQAFRAFRQRQRAYLNYYATVTFLLAPFFQSDWSLLGWCRDCALPLLPKLPGIKRQMLMTLCGLKGGFLSGEIEV